MSETRTCRNCGITKPLSSFYSCYTKGRTYYRRECKKCVLSKQTEYAKRHKEKRATYLKQYRTDHKERIRLTVRLRQHSRLQNDPLYRAKRNARLCIWKAFNGQGQVSDAKVMHLVGCSSKALTDYLKQTWLERYGTPWTEEPHNIDHIVPLLTAKTEADIQKLCHFTNLRLVTPEDNLSKGIEERIIKEEE